MRRAEVDYDDMPPTPTVGHAEAVADQSDMADVAAILWIPDIEQRRGWRELYIRKAAPKPGSRTVGFRRI